MDLAISNIAWSPEDDDIVYDFLQRQGIHGLEIAPSRIFPDTPYSHLKEAEQTALSLRDRFGLQIVSMQSIWYGKSQSIFGSKEERAELYSYTQQAVDFASAIGCRNLVFGCPKNRIYQNENQIDMAVEFFGRLGECAARAGAVIAIEANPTIYGTNFLNTTEQALAFLKNFSGKGIGLNYDFGTVLQNQENLLKPENFVYVNHVHISEPFLNKICFTDRHAELAKLLSRVEYNKYVSVEMKNPGDLPAVMSCVKEFQRVFS